MVETKTCINVWSDMNTWIDFCVIVSDSDLEYAKTSVQQAYDNWWTIPDAQFETLADYVSRYLYENGIEFKIYFKDESKEE